MTVTAQMKNLFIDTTTCSSGLAIGLAQYCAERGVDLSRHADMVGLDPAMFENAKHRLNLGRFAALLTALVEDSGDEAFALKFGQVYRLGDAGPVGLAMLHAPNLEKMWEFYKKVSDLMIEQTIYTLSADGKYFINENVCSPLIQNTDALTDLMSAVFIRHIRVHTGRNWMVPRIELQRKKPKDAAPWREMFGNGVIFDRPFARNYTALEDLKCGSPDADPRLFEVLSATSFRLLEEYKSSHGFMDRVRSLVTRNLQMQRATLSVIASDMAMSERSLQRLLARFGTDFGSVVLEIRLAMAHVLLSRSDLRIVDVAERCGYSSAAAFSRAIVRAEGMGPAELRRMLIAK